MKIDLVHGLEGYIFFILLAAASIYAGVIALKTHLSAAIFCFVVGIAVLAVTTGMMLRKR